MPLLTMQRENLFQSTPLCEGRPLLSYRLYTIAPFQSTPLCEGRREPVVGQEWGFLFQSTPLCEGRQYASVNNATGEFVSIHAPVRGATYTP